jgi:hypothetical protein
VNGNLAGGLKMKTIFLAAALIGLTISPVSAQTGKSDAPGASRYAPGQKQNYPGEAKDFSPGQKQKNPGDAKNFAPGQKHKTKA